jgi:hypothetical protein
MKNAVYCDMMTPCGNVSEILMAEMSYRLILSWSFFARSSAFTINILDISLNRY